MSRNNSTTKNKRTNKYSSNRGRRSASDLRRPGATASAWARLRNKPRTDSIRAIYPGECSRCEKRIAVGQEIHQHADFDGYVHFGCKPKPEVLEASSGASSSDFSEPSPSAMSRLASSSAGRRFSGISSGRPARSSLPHLGVEEVHLLDVLAVRYHDWVTEGTHRKIQKAQFHKVIQVMQRRDSYHRHVRAGFDCCPVLRRRVHQGHSPGVLGGQPQNVAYIAAEEPLDLIVKPSLRASGAVLGRMVFPRCRSKTST
jgi:hypothetical protein